MSVEHYVEHVLMEYLISSDFDADACGRWLSSERLQELFECAIDIAISDYGYASGTEYNAILEKHWSGLINAQAIQFEGDEFTGIYGRCDVAAKDIYCKAVMAENPATARVNVLGDDALRTALSNIAAREGWRDGSADEQDDEPFGSDEAVSEELESRGADQILEVAPASNRIVTFSDNQIVDLDARTTQVIEAVEEKNQIDGNPGMRELLIGQLKAGRELIRAGSFKLYLIEHSLISALQFLVERYEREAVGGLAAALITALVKQIGIDA